MPHHQNTVALHHNGGAAGTGESGERPRNRLPTPIPAFDLAATRNRVPAQRRVAGSVGAGGGQVMLTRRPFFFSTIKPMENALENPRLAAASHFSERDYWSIVLRAILARLRPG
jgi:hypothetical protein